MHYSIESAIADMNITRIMYQCIGSLVSLVPAKIHSSVKQINIHMNTVGRIK